MGGDAYCDDANNNAGCNWDNGDCCGVSNNYKYCQKCKCLDCTFTAEQDTCGQGKFKGCGAPNWKGDGNCDDNNNRAGCDWDGGDCCGLNNYNYCNECKCKDCNHVPVADGCMDDKRKK